MKYMKEIKIQYGHSLKTYGEPLFFSFLAFIILFNSYMSKEDSNYKEMLMIGLFFTFCLCCYFLSAVVRGIVGRFIRLGSGEIKIPHEFLPCFDKTIKKNCILKIDMPHGRFGIILITTSSGDIIIAPELVKSYGVELLFADLKKWYSSTGK